MAMLYGHKTVQKERHRKFSSGSRWKATYRDLMFGKSGARVRWDEVIELQQGFLDEIIEHQHEEERVDLFSDSSESDDEA